MDLIEFGKRVRIIREEILNMNQAELAEKIKTNQVLLSRLENGIGGSINLVFDLLNYLNKKKLAAAMIFREPFDLDYISNVDKVFTPNDKLIEIIKELKESATIDYEKLVLVTDLITVKKAKKN